MALPWGLCWRPQAACRNLSWWGWLHGSDGVPQVVGFQLLASQLVSLQHLWILSTFLSVACRWLSGCFKDSPSRTDQFGRSLLEGKRPICKHIQFPSLWALDGILLCCWTRKKLGAHHWTSLLAYPYSDRNYDSLQIIIHLSLPPPVLDHWPWSVPGSII